MLLCLLCLLSAGSGENVDAHGDRSEKMRLHEQNAVLYGLKKSGGNLIQGITDAPADCDPFPIPTSPEGPTIVHELVDWNDEYVLTTWRYPCNEEFSWVMFTIEPAPESEPFICLQIILNQGTVSTGDYYLTQDPAMEDEPFCANVTKTRTLAISRWSLDAANIDLQSEFDISWDIFGGDHAYTIFAYDPTAYGSLGAPVLSNQVAVNGLFFDPSNPGHGFDFNMHTYGLTVFYYGHTVSGDRLWLISATHEDPIEYGVPFTIDLVEIVNGTFGNPVPPDTEWGTVTITMTDCDNGIAALDGQDGTIEIAFTRLVGLKNSTCGQRPQ
jgi:hypothetical protein